MGNSLLTPLLLCDLSIGQAEWNVDDVGRFIESTCRSKFGHEKTEQYKRLVIDNDVDGEVTLLFCASLCASHLVDSCWSLGKKSFTSRELP